MAFNFPNSPTEGQVFQPPGGSSYVWRNPVWELVTPSAGSDMLTIVDGITAPATVSGVAQIYVDAADGDLKIRFGDGVTKTIVVDT